MRMSTYHRVSAFAKGGPFNFGFLFPFFDFLFFVASGFWLLWLLAFVAFGFRGFRGFCGFWLLWLLAFWLFHLFGLYLSV